MKKSSENKLYQADTHVTQASEPYVSMQPIKKLPAAIADFSYNKFKRIADKVPFTQSEWASILHLSERTLQRYAKDNRSFEGIYVDRILQIDKLINLGLETFTDAEALTRWLRRSKNVLGQELSFKSLFHTDGINAVKDEIGRIQHGVYI